MFLLLLFVVIIALGVGLEMARHKSYLRSIEEDDKA